MQTDDQTPAGPRQGTTPPGETLEPLYTLKDCAEAGRRIFLKHLVLESVALDSRAGYEIAKELNDWRVEYEADRARAASRIAELEADNSRITGYYLRYYHIMHSMAIATMDRVKRIEELEAMLARRLAAEAEAAVNASSAGAGVMPRYGHRNGESEPPTIEGEFWFRGKLHHGDYWHDVAGIESVKIHWRTKKFFIPGEEGDHDLDTAEGQWWGPIVEPWHAPALPD